DPDPEPDPTTPFVMDGKHDAGAQQVGSGTEWPLYAAWNGVEQYLAQKAAPPSGADGFLMIGDGTTTSKPAPWGKAGTVPGLLAFVGNESTNNYAGWLGAGSATVGVSAGT